MVLPLNDITITKYLKGTPMKTDALDALNELSEYLDACEVAVLSTDELIETIRKALSKTVDVEEIERETFEGKCNEPYTRPKIDWWWLCKKLEYKKAEIRRLNEQIRTGRINTVDGKFKRDDYVRKKGDKGQWHGRVCGTYSTECTPIGYNVESVYEKNSVQIYPESALESWEPTGRIHTGGERFDEKFMKRLQERCVHVIQSVGGDDDPYCIKCKLDTRTIDPALAPFLCDDNQR